MTSKRQKSLCALLTLLIAFGFSTAITRVAAQQTVQYVYDENGRLRAVISPSGETTVYTYDAMGNIVSITKRTTPLVNISGFTPGSASVGAIVTIFGSGFSAIPAEDTVNFNGVAATVVSATVSQIVTTVPANATTGRITVSSSNGAATSRTDFVVRAALEITSFDPFIGTPDTSVTVAGIGFDESIQNNTLKFNGFPATIDTASNQQIVASVPPGATSGHLSITTGGNTAISSGDFFVPPPPYSVDDVDVTGRIAAGETKSLAISSGRVGLIVFDGTVGQRISIGTNNVTFSFIFVTLYAPNGTILSQSFAGQGNSSFNAILPSIGTYTLLIDTFGNLGGLNLSLTAIVDVSVPIIPGGPPVNIAIGTPGQNASLNFTGTAGQKVSLAINNVTIPDGNVALVGPNGNSLASTFITTDAQFGGQQFLDTVTLPDAGLYKIIIDPFFHTGVATFTLYNVVDVSSSIVVDGDPVLVTTTTPGQNATLTFDGTEGRSLNLNLSAVSFAGERISVFAPDGSILVPPTLVGSQGGGGGVPTLAAGRINGPKVKSNLASPPGSADGDIAITNLPTSGSYTILLDPTGPGVGSATLKLSTIIDVTGSIAIDGPALTLSTTMAGQNATVTFSGAADQHVFISLTNVSICGSFVSVNNPDGSTLVNPVFVDTAGGGIDIYNLPVAGTYTILIDPENSCKGDFTIQASSTASIEIGGPPITVAFTTPGQTASYTFIADAGRRVRVNTSGISIPSGSINILGPDGSVVFNGSLFGFSHVSLPDTGTYTLVVDPEGNTGAIKINLNNSSGGSGD